MAAVALPSTDPIHPEAFLRVADICGRRPVSEEEARRNRESGRGPRRARASVRGLLSVSPSTWWLWCQTGVAPHGVKVGGATLWRAGDVLALASRSPNAQEG
jgi:hypothetical protein